MALTSKVATPDRTKNLLGWTLILGVVALVVYARWFWQNGATISQAEIRKALAPASLEGMYPCVYGSFSDGKLTSQLGTCTTPVSCARPEDLFETDLRYGSFILRQTDLPLNDVFHASLERAYSSSDWGSPSHQHAFGFNANDSFDIAPTGSRWPYTYMTLMLEDNDFLYFKRISPGTGFANAVYLHTETSTRYYGATIAWNGNGWTLRRRDGTEMLFPEAYAAKNLAQGAVYEVKNAAGDKLMLKRDPQRNLQEVLTPHGHWIRFQDDAQGRITRATDDHGHMVRYQYNPAGMLSDVFFSNGMERHYQYQGRLMTSVTDERGNVLVRNWYRGGNVVRQLFGGRDLYTYDYSWFPGSHYMNEVVVTLPNGTEEDLYPGPSVPAFLRGHP